MNAMANGKSHHSEAYQSSSPNRIPLVLSFKPPVVTGKPLQQPVMETKPNIKLLSHEVFAQICSRLEPIWIRNLSLVCKDTRARLNFELGNLVWYESIPLTLMTVPEKLQPAPQTTQTGAQHAIVHGLRSPYPADFNYQAEIMGHVRSGRRCYICLGGPLLEQAITCWGLK